MKSLAILTIPGLGSLYAQRDQITLPRWELEDLSGPEGRDWLLCLGSLRIYLTPHLGRSRV